MSLFAALTSVFLLASPAAPEASRPQAPHRAAQAQGSQQFQTQFEKVVDNCKESALALKKGPVTVAQRSDQVTLDIESLPTLRGQMGRRGKLQASGSQQAGQKETRYGLSGRIKNDELSAVLVAEYFSKGAPLCTQSWSLEGKKD